MTADELAQIANGFAPVMKKFVAQQIAEATGPLVARIAALETQLAVKYCGTYRDGTDYVAGSLVTRSGALWLATADTHETPGTGSASWKLVVKSGHAAG